MTARVIPHFFGVRFIFGATTSTDSRQDICTVTENLAPAMDGDTASGSDESEARVELSHESHAFQCPKVFP